MPHIAPNSPVADWRCVPQGYGYGNFYDPLSNMWATVTRTTTKTTRTADGRILDVPAGYLALEPWSLHKSGGIGWAAIIEEARTNAFLRSYIPDATALAAWTADAGLTATLGGSAHGLYGASKGAVLAADASNRAFWQQVTSTAVAWAISCYVRKSDLSAVTADDMQLCAAAGTSTPVGTLLTTTFTAFANGWYRATATFMGTAAAWTCGVAVKANKAVQVECLGVGIGAFSTSYIPTTTAAVTRNADVATVPTTGWSTAAGTWVAVRADSPSTARHLSWAGADGTIFFGGVGDSIVRFYAGLTDTSRIGTGTVRVAAGTYATAVGVRPFNNGLAGTLSAAYTAMTSPAVTAYVGSNAGATQWWNSPIARFAIYTSALSAETLATASMTTDLLAGLDTARITNEVTL